MRIAVDLTSLDDNFSGIERYALNICKEMIQHDDENTYILIFKNSVYHSYEKLIDDKKVIAKVIKGKKRLIFAQLTLTKYLYKIKADKYLFLAFPSPVLFIKKGIINTIHDLTAWDYPGTMTFLSRLYFKIGIKNAINISEKIITVSQFSKRRIIEKFKCDNIHVIYNGISDVFMNYDKNISDGSVLKIKAKYGLTNKYLMCLCTLEPRKNIELLIKSYVELRNEQKLNFKLVLVGRKGWKVEKLLSEINSKYSNDIIITGFVDDIDLPIIYKESSCFIFPSLYEGFGIPVIEAMYMNVPVICSNTSSLPEIVKECGILFENNNKEDLKEKIMEFIKMNKEEIFHMTKLAEERAKKFSWTNEAIKLIELL